MSTLTPNGVLSLDIQVNIADVAGNTLMPMLMRLQKRNINQRSVNWNANVGGAGAVGESVTTSVSSYTSDNVRPASLAIGADRLRSSFQLLRNDINEAAAIGKGALVDLVKYSASGAMREILETAASKIYTGTGISASGGIVGLDSIVATATSSKSTVTYAGIDPGTYAHWTNYVNTAGSNRALTTALLEKMSEEMLGGKTIGVNSNYTAVYASPATVTTYKELFAANTQIQQAPYNVADVGFSGVAFEGRPVILDPYATDGVLYFINEPDLYFYSVNRTSRLGEQGNVENGISFSINQLPSDNPDAVNFAITGYFQLQLQRRAAFAALKALS